MLYFPETGSDSELSWEHSSGHAKESVRDAEKDVKDLKGNKILSTEAKNILSDLELDTDDESGGSLLHYAGLLIFRAVADPRNLGISAKSREIPQKTRNTTKSARNISKYMSTKHI